MSTPKYFIDKLSSVKPNKQNGIVKITFGVDEDGKTDDTVQLIVSAGDLQGIMQSIGETMQKTFGGMGGPGGPGGRGMGKSGKGGPMQSFKDLTKD